MIRTSTRLNLTTRTVGHPTGSRTFNPLACRSTGPELKRTTIEPHTNGRNRPATARKNVMMSAPAGGFLNIGPNTMERKIMPPIQLTAAIT